jgi:transcriptional regulator with XRE-family HTH domain
MKTRDEFPTIVKNLRKIWNKKRLEMQFTQVTAAKELGWTQGAISHYLSGITEIRAPAIIKLANFLDVDPRDIDPNIEESLPSITRKNVKWSANDMTTPIDKVIFSRSDDESFLIEVPHTSAAYRDIFKSPCPAMSCYVRLTKPANMREPKMFAARLKAQKTIKFYLPNDVPPAAKISHLWSVVQVIYT